MLKGDYQKAKDFSTHNLKSLYKCLFFMELLKGNGTQSAFLMPKGTGQAIFLDSWEVPALKLYQIYCKSDISMAREKDNDSGENAWCYSSHFN